MFDTYEHRRELSVLQRDEDRWKTLFEFQTLLESNPRWASVRLASGDYAVYELMFRCEPHKYITRPRFITALRDIYDFQVALVNQVKGRKPKTS